MFRFRVLETKPNLQLAQPLHQLVQLHRRHIHVRHACPHIRLVKTAQVLHAHDTLVPSKSSQTIKVGLIAGNARGSQLLCEQRQKRGSSGC
jgi:hypothetical protein